jgi:hypothetical protein
MKKLTILTALLAVFAMVSMAGAQDVAVTFDEAGTVTMGPIAPGQVNIYVVGFGFTEISGYEFLLTPTVAPAFFLGKTTYGIAPLDLGTQYEVRCGTGGCVSDATIMGPDPNSWTMCQYQLGYFSGVSNDTYFCLSASPGSLAPYPQYTICDQDATKAYMYPANVDLTGQAPGACAVGNPTMGQDIVDAEETSFGSLKSRF